MSSHLTSIDTTIHQEDEMLLNAISGLYSEGLARAVYLRQGFEIHTVLMSVLEWIPGKTKASAKVLDFACGYGRSTRFLVAEVPPENVWVSDIYEGAVDFQKSQFGVNGFVSRYEAAQLECDERFDLVFVASLFTHLPRLRFEQWLAKLHSFLGDKGILAFSVHDSALAQGRTMPPDGFLYVTESESRSLDLEEYGSTYVSEAFVSQTIAKVLGSGYSYRRLPQALCGSHDIYLVSRDSNETFVSFNYVNPPVGYVDWFSLSDEGAFRIGGWAAEHDSNHSIISIEISIEDKIVGTLKPSFDRPDVAHVLGKPHTKHSGWDFWLEGFDRDRDGEKVVEVILRSTTGRMAILHSSQLKDASQPTLPPPQQSMPAPPAPAKLLERLRAMLKS